MDLHREVGHFSGHFGAEQLGHRGRHSAIFTGQPFAGGVAHQCAAGQHTGLLIGKHGLNKLEGPDRRSALGRGDCEADRFVQCSLCGADRQCGNVNPSPRQGCERSAVTDVLVAADECLRPEADIGEIHVRGPGAFLPHFCVLDADLDSRRIGRDQEHRDAGSVAVGRPGAGEYNKQICQGGIGDPALLTRDHPIRSVANGFGAKARGVRTRSRFGERE